MDDSRLRIMEALDHSGEMDRAGTIPVEIPQTRNDH